ncbi:hypothetical protein PNK_1686 [Candidatus Protochlamydia naegleriophila]|uniref:Uncharacterized protein n=1 Tax=Candidatus Protochlamydia naegleriophila TaxID=389348 RepID=A0A0U5JFV6_9BACT|nr:hypothetical protein [Candidatus Protochlamydia naegleriophila]CUI17295.1 hypothetical protein PNK_1686 [Candidatus Protochlamydia naegleriophila]
MLLGNADDLVTLTLAFHDDKTIAFDEKTFLARRNQIEIEGLILFGINSKSQIKKQILESTKTTPLQSQPLLQGQPGSVSGSLKGTPKLTDGHIFMIFDRENGKKALGVKECDFEAVMNIDRSYR